MENRTIQELFSRKSVRVFSDEKITEEEKRLILEAAIQAPTAGNMSLFSILDIQSQEIKDVLAKRCDNQNFIAEAPVVLVFLADYQRWCDVLESYEMTIPPMEKGLIFSNAGLYHCGTECSCGIRVYGNRFLLYRRYSGEL